VHERHDLPPNSEQVARASYRYYVVDRDLRVRLIGPDPAELAPAVGPQTRLPLDLKEILATIVATHDFSAEQVARESTRRKSLEVARVGGPAGEFFAVAVRAELPARRRVRKPKADLPF
jgi:hypothetical protein